ncbi:sigma-54-dependent Fis family transcriptional regulator [Gammaproteobacteria bacterium 53_120_T64]|nr:sigma-54-dependent Fis family transcriptional regulator [Gammaproteobacteria bacterium 53_120_T64]
MALKILVVEDDDLLREALCDTLAFAGYGVEFACDGVEALALLHRQSVDLVVSDVQMAAMDGHALLQNIKRTWPRLPVVLMTAFGCVEKAVAAMRDGAADYLIKPFEAEVLIAMVSRFAHKAAGDGAEMIAEDPRAQQVVELARRVAASDATVMLSGESGTGKEVLARFIHDNSSRCDGPFVAINCAALPETMLESILFGYEKGAFTGAHQARAGKFEQAEGGTLLLDEISEMDVALQAKLLRVLQEKEVERLGGKGTIALDVRVLATTNRDLRGEVTAGRFREDLFYRLNVFPIALAPLRERRGDILPLVRRFVDEQSGAGQVVNLSPRAAQMLEAYAWPGNIRELHNVVQRAMILLAGDILGEADIHLEEPGAPVSLLSVPSTVAAPAEALDGSALENDLRGHEQQIIVDALKAERGRRKETAERLGISPRTLRYKLAKLRDDGIVLPDMYGT